MGTIHIEQMLIRGALPEGENPLPQFRSPKHDLNVTVRDGFPKKYTAHLGRDTGFRMLPYARQDRYSQNKKPLDLKTIVFENDCLRAVFLPDYGARLVSLVDKKTCRELLYRNSVFQPANLAIRNAWFSGGIEWNIGQYGHAFTTCSPVFCSVQKDVDGEDFLRIYEYERCKGFFWQIDFHLPEGSALLGAHVTVYNIDAAEKSMYYWTNTAIAQTADSRVFSGVPDVLYIDPYAEPGTKRFGFGRLPNLEILPGIDATYPSRSTYANEYFFACDGESRPWESAVEKNGQGFFEASTERLKYRKMFCWGSLRGSKRWAEFLSASGESYFEIQAGLAPTQLHGIVMPPESSWNWTQVFGAIHADSGKAFDSDWNSARAHVGAAVDRKIPAEKIYSLDERYASAARVPCGELIHSGSGWGALESERRRKSGQTTIPLALRFPLSSMQDGQRPWINLLYEGVLLPKRPEDLPLPYIVQHEWKDLLEKSLSNAEESRLWAELLHLGVIAMEEGDTSAAEKYWLRSLEICESAWAYRNLACIQKQAGTIAAALELYRKAAMAPGFAADRAIAEEMLSLLVDAGLLDEASVFYSGLDATWKLDSDTLAVLHGFICVRTGDADGAEEVLRRKFANIREGETPLSDIWFELQSLKYARQNGVQPDEATQKMIRETCVPPFELDFRMV